MKTLTALTLLALLSQSALAGELAAPIDVELRTLSLTGGFFNYTQSMQSVNPTGPVTVDVVVDGQSPNYGHLDDAIAEFSLAGVSTATPVLLTLDVSRATYNGSPGLPTTGGLSINVMGATGPIQLADFPPLWSFGTGGTYDLAVPLGNFSTPLAESVDITSAIQRLESQGYGLAEVYVGTDWSITASGPPSVTFSFDPATVPEPQSLMLLPLGVAFVVLAYRQTRRHRIS
jgi:hypothetical protein